MPKASCSTPYFWNFISWTIWTPAVRSMIHMLVFLCLVGAAFTYLSDHSLLFPISYTRILVGLKSVRGRFLKNSGSNKMRKILLGVFCEVFAFSQELFARISKFFIFEQYFVPPVIPFEFCLSVKILGMTFTSILTLYILRLL